MMEYYTIIYAILFLVVLGISYGCLGGKKEGFLATTVVSSIATTVIVSLGMSIYLAISDEAWTVKEYKDRTEKIDSVKVKNNILTFYGPGKLRGIKVVKSKEKDSKAQIYNSRRSTGKDKITGIILSYDLEERVKSEIYLCEPDYETWKAFKGNRKK
jgi:hypothetical protein